MRHPNFVLKFPVLRSSGRRPADSGPRGSSSDRAVISTHDSLALDHPQIAIHGETNEPVHLFAGARPLNLNFINPLDVSGSQHLTGIVGR